MLNNLFIFFVALFMVIRGATWANLSATRIAESFRLSKYVVGFIIIAIISILPETLISINAAVAGVPSFGLGILFGSNVADLTLIFAFIVLAAGRDVRVESKIINNQVIYPFILLLPLILGFDGYFSRIEGAALILVGGIFYYAALRGNVDDDMPVHEKQGWFKPAALLCLSMAVLLIGSHFTVTSATALAQTMGVSPILIGMLIVALGTTMPELFFSLKAIRKQDDSLAVGDLLGTVLADATIVVGILALVAPFAFPKNIIYITGAFMVVASFILFQLMRSGRSLAQREAWLLIAFWLLFVFVAFFASAS